MVYIDDLLMAVEDAAHADLYRLRCYLRGTTPDAERERMLADALDALNTLEAMSASMPDDSGTAIEHRGTDAIDQLSAALAVACSATVSVMRHALDELREMGYLAGRQPQDAAGG